MNFLLLFQKHKSQFIIYVITTNISWNYTTHWLSNIYTYIIGNNIRRNILEKIFLKKQPVFWLWSNQIYIFKAWYFSYLLGSHFEWLICHFELEFFLEAEFHLHDATKPLGSDRHPLHNPIWYLHHSKLSHHRVLAKNMV